MGELAANTRRLWLASSPKGFAPDWLLWTPAGKPAADTKHGNAGDYDAIRVYLWVGMLAEGAAQRRELVAHYAPMAALTQRQGLPPEHLDARSGEAAAMARQVSLRPCCHCLLPRQSTWPAWRPSASACANNRSRPRRTTARCWRCSARASTRPVTVLTRTAACCRPGVRHAANDRRVDAGGNNLPGRCTTQGYR